MQIANQRTEGISMSYEEVVVRRIRRSAISGIVAIAVAAATLAAAATAVAAVGDNFSFAPVETQAPDPVTDAPAFPNGPDARAFWAGVCDLAFGAAATVAQPPLDRQFPGCIEHPPSSIPVLGDFVAPIAPLAPGVPAGGSGPDGWIGSAPSWRLADVTQAAARPDGSASFWFSRAAEPPSGTTTEPGIVGPDGQPRTIRVSLPPGVIGNPRAIPKCAAEDVNAVPTSCPPKTQVGLSTLLLADKTAVYPVYNVEPRKGNTAEFIISRAGFDAANNTNAPIVATARTDGDFGVDAMAVEIPAGLAFTAQTFTFWGVPWAASHDRYRPVAGYCGTKKAGDGAFATFGMPVDGLPGGTGGNQGGCSQEPQHYDPSWGPVRPFFATQTKCSDPDPTTTIFAHNWHTSVVATADSLAPQPTGCANVPFDAAFDLATTSSTAESASGLDVDLTIPQNNDPPASKRFNNADHDPDSAVAHWKSAAGLATAHLKDSVVTLPEGFSVNPSSATGLQGCSDAEIGVTDAGSNPLRFNNGDPFNKDGGADGAECPDGSVIGTAQVTTPLLDEVLTGEVVLGVPRSTDPRSGQMLRLFIVVRNRDRGLIAKIHGSTKADGVVGEGGSGQLVATFENNPEVPFDNLKLSFKGGQRGVLATPQRCGDRAWTSTFAPWSGNAPVVQGGQFPVASNCGFGFAPGLRAGMDTQVARSHGRFSFTFSRRDGEQWFKSLTAVLPQGLLASVKGLIGPNLCSDAQASRGNCPVASRIGTVDAAAGAGDPFVLEHKGEVFLTEGYKGGQYGLAVKVRPIAGPFRGAMELSSIVVRQAIHVDRETAQVTAVSDAFPKVWHGVPLRVREVVVNVDRDRFMLNPSDCDAKQVAASLDSTEGQTAGLSNRFQATGCADLAFKPKLTLKLTGRKQVKTGKHPGIKATVTQQGIPEAGIEKAEVRLPKSLALDVDNAQALCEFEAGTKPDVENHCPKGSIVGRARAVSPLLNDPLAGNVYFVKNVRRSSSGNLIRTLPMIVVALRGEIAVNLVGESNVKNGKLVNTFDNVPDAPITQFNLNIQGGRNGILAVTRTRKALINLCTGRHIAEADMDGQNGRRHDFDVRMTTPCTKRQTKAAKRNAKRAAAKARAGGKSNSRR